MMEVYNFSAGPAMLPKEVMETAKEEFCDFMGTGSGVMELSHRGPQFMEVLATAKQNTRDLMEISDDYEICFIQGGASMQFAMIPMNLLPAGGVADYADSGTWSAKAIKEAERFGKVNIVGSSKSTNYDRIPLVRHWKPSENAAYLHITSNNTIAGTQYHTFPPVPEGVPMIADMSSDFMSRVIDVNDFGMLYGGAQKNLGPSGMALVIIRKDLAERTPDTVPTMLRYKTYIDKDSMFNTPPTFAIYMYKQVTEWMKAKGGLPVIEEINNTKSEALYELLDRSGFYSSPVEPGSRSKMNVVFRLPSEELEAKFIKEAAQNGMSGLKGHRSVGGIRASIYNAMPLAGVEALIDFMLEFEKKNG
ncbi:3-phosphoserine/phosphohydroxythreonine transaminase [Lentisphaerota bacterium ZTH]|nr:3-phosphoserine/phosphohydroxythreonine transaminase [Lentisphaerota bacterium]WET05589.1 3-phosphoserine/phosphohydroxythreonine transaminase [Lentisphaerota bacterium ZTH]